MKIEKFQQLTQDEAGQLRGGFSIQLPSDIGNTNLNNKNGNCGNGGSGDSNANCSCKACENEVVVAPITPITPNN